MALRGTAPAASFDLANDQRLRLLADHAPVGIFQTDSDGNCVFVNQTWVAMAGLSAREALGEGWQRAVHPDDRERVRQEWIDATCSGKRFSIEFRFLRPDGMVIWLQGSAAELPNDDGVCGGYIGTIADVTDRKQAEEVVRRANVRLEERVRERTAQLAEVNARFQAMYDQGLFAGLLAPDGTLIDANRSSLEACGFKREDVIGKKFWDTGWWNRSPDVQAWLKAGFRQALDGKPFRDESIYFVADGSERIVDFALMPIKDDEGRIPYVVPTGMDITERRRSEDQKRSVQVHRESEARFRYMANHAPVLIWTCDTSMKCTWLNQPWLDFVGRPIEKELGLGWTENVHRDDLQSSLRAFKEAFEARRPFQMDYRLRRRDGQYQWVVSSGLPLYDEFGNFTGYVGSGIDITDRKNAEQQMRDANRIAETLNRIGLRLSAQLDLEAAVQMVTDEATALIGAEFGAFFYNAADQRGETYMLFTLSGASLEKFQDFPMPRNTDLFAPTFRGESPVRVADVTQDPRYGKSAPYFGAPPGHLPVRSYLAVPVVSHDQQVMGGLFLGHSQVGVFTEQHERLIVGMAAQAAIAMENARLYREVRNADRRKDEFLAMLAHELRNPLAPIRSGLDLLAITGADPEVISPMQQQVEHLIRLVDDLLDVSRIMRGKIQLRRERIDLATVIARAVETVRPLIESSEQQLSLKCPPDPIRLEADPVRLSQVISNLLNNASKYTNRGGRIRLTARMEPAVVVIEVADNGMGIDGELLPRVFDLFTQATAAIDRSQGGLGIGLTVVKSLVEMHNGTVTVESAGLGKGSTFRIQLPRPIATSNSPSSGERPA